MQRIHLHGDAYLTLTDDFLDGCFDFLSNMIASVPSTVSHLSVSEFAEDQRNMPQESPRPGPYTVKYTPYQKEIMDVMSVRSPVQKVYLIKGVQLGFTLMAENIICYYIGEFPSSQMFISATEAMLKDWSTKRLDPAIESFGLDKAIYSMTGHKRSRRTGNKVLTKDYPGGSLKMVSGRSAPSLRMFSCRVIIIDEVDAIPRDVGSEGSFLDIAEGRTRAFGDNRKILIGSTPTSMSASLVYQAYLEGDRREYFVPCPLCGSYQVLEWEPTESDESYGMKWTMDATNTRAVDVWYECRHCHEQIRNHDKTFMLENGEWRPTVESTSETIRSYHISSLYSPVGMQAWKDLVEQYIKAQENPEKMKVFFNLVLGKPWAETGKRIKPKATALRGVYKSRDVPKGVLFLTAGADVQAGSEMDAGNPARIEMTVYGHGMKRKAWALEHLVFKGAVDDVGSGAWEQLSDWIENKSTFKGYGGIELGVKVVLVDSGALTDVVYNWCRPYTNIFPSKGDTELRRRKGDSRHVDPMTNLIYVKYRMTNLKNEMQLVTISTNIYKQIIYRNLMKHRPQAGFTPSGFIDFPADFTDTFFKQLTTEEMLEDGSFSSGGRRNEALDCCVYAMAGADLYIDSEIKVVREIMKQKRFTNEVLESFGEEQLLKEMYTALYPDEAKIIAKKPQARR